MILIRGSKKGKGTRSDPSNDGKRSAVSEPYCGLRTRKRERSIGSLMESLLAEPLVRLGAAVPAREGDYFCESLPRYDEELSRGNPGSLISLASKLEDQN